MTSQYRAVKSRSILLKIALGLALTSGLFSPVKVLAASQPSPDGAPQTAIARGNAVVATPKELVTPLLNRVRTSPAEYAAWLEALRSHYEGDAFRFHAGELAIRTTAGVALDAAIHLSTKSPMFLTLEAELVAERPMSEDKKMTSRSAPVGSMDDSTWFGNLSGTQLSTLSEELIAETNKMRTNPAAYAQRLEAIRDYYEGNLVRVPGRPAVQVVEGVSALDEAIAVLRRSPPLGALAFSPGMSLGANDHATDLGSKGITGHYGSDGSDPFARINRYGAWHNSASENISYGQATIAEWHLINLLVDDNVPSRGHRQALLDPTYSAMGAACHEHSGFRIVCVMNYASEYQEKP